MIGIVIVTHGNLGEALIDASAFILGNKPESPTGLCQAQPMCDQFLYRYTTGPDQFYCYGCIIGTISV